MDGIAQTHLLRFHHILIVRGIPELDKVDVDIHLWLGQAGVLQIILCKGAHHLIRGLILKSTGAIQYCDLLVRHRPLLHQHHLFRQLRHLAGLGILPVRMYTRDYALNVPLHLEVDEVFAVDDMHAVVCAPVMMELDGVSVPLVLSAKGVQHRAVDTAEAVPKRGRHREPKRGAGGDIRPDLKGALGCRVVSQPRQRTGAAGRGKRRNRNEV